MLLARKGFAQPAHGHHVARVQARRARRGFGHGQVRTFGPPVTAVRPALRWSNDLRLFASTFVGGFLFVAVLLA